MTWQCPASALADIQSLSLNDSNQPEAAFKCKRHSLIAPFAGALIPVRTIGLVQQSHCKNTVNYAILSKIR